jgi:hypothetical protein
MLLRQIALITTQYDSQIQDCCKNKFLQQLSKFKSWGEGIYFIKKTTNYILSFP